MGGLALLSLDIITVKDLRGGRGWCLSYESRQRVAVTATYVCAIPFVSDLVYAFYGRYMSRSWRQFRYSSRRGGPP